MFTALFIMKPCPQWNPDWIFWDFHDEFLSLRPRELLDVQGQFDHQGIPCERYRIDKIDLMPGEFFPIYLDTRFTSEEGETAVKLWCENIWPTIKDIPPLDWPYQSHSTETRSWALKTFQTRLSV